MTKNVHVINGDTSNWKVQVKVQDKKFTYNDDNELLPWFGEWKDAEVLDLNNPGQLLTKYITSTRRIVIEENGNL